MWFETENTLSIDELKNAVKLMKVWKCYGSDGLKFEFYKFFWKEPKFLVFESFTSAYKHELMPKEQR